MFQEIVSGGYENRTICALKQRSRLCFSVENAIAMKLGRVQSKRNWRAPAARTSVRHDKYVLSFTNLLLQLLVANSTLNANGLKIFTINYRTAIDFASAMIVASHEFSLHIDVKLFEN